MEELCPPLHRSTTFLIPLACQASILNFLMPVLFLLVVHVTQQAQFG